MGSKINKSNGHRAVHESVTAVP
jgi:hypothetical protein